MAQELQNQVALVTGASGGIGRACALRLADAGATVVLHYHRNRGAAQSLAEILSPRAQLVQADLRSFEDIDRLDKAISGLDILINNAGVWQATPLGGTSADAANETIDTNLRAVFWLTSALSPRLKSGARIVNISSVAAQTASASGRSLYRATKAAIDALTRNWALELAPRGIRVNAVAPGMIETAMTEAHLADITKRTRLLARHPLGRFTTVEEIAEAVFFLCSNRSSHITGQILNVSGGFVI
jgi:NAD(P)-dependent dehydrogenase (short-subunit alcohol dehydrogenase family)